MKYPFRAYVAKSEGHEFWIAESSALKGCAGQGETYEEAFKELEENEIEWLETAEEVGIPIPEMPIEKMDGYSGKFTVRVAPYVHREAVENAKQQGISLNQYVSDAMVALNSKFGMSSASLG